MKHWNFPITAAEFIQYQEKLCGRGLNVDEYDMTIKALTVINEAYEDGKEGITTGLYPRHPDDFLSEMPNKLFTSLVVRRYMLALVALSTAAWERGCKDAEKVLSAS